MTKSIDDYVAKVVAKAPPLSVRQRDLLAVLLTPPEPLPPAEDDDLASLKEVLGDD